ncbi:putative ribosomal RNA assembly protein [Paramicrosporidium saccamoebae]|uniref:Pre-rRNA-processing protein PNO1 n=1 Tax=Paramicrosporidium saccamoebae TaxID=1246581 RepID=A0A2H9TPX7_9FUNG|nr:putative ribosomal RNA assembly protein [Paramicrosporidium saccamoebae]
MSPLRDSWMKIYTPLVEHMKLQVRFNPKTRTVELRNSHLTTETSALQKGADFVRGFAVGFNVEDALVLLRLDDIYVDSFEIKDVKTLNGDHLSRAIGRLAGRNGKTKVTIENTSRTRVVLADSKIHILGSYRNIQVAKNALVSLILGSTPGTVYTRLRNVAARLAERRM